MIVTVAVRFRDPLYCEMTPSLCLYFTSNSSLAPQAARSQPPAVLSPACSCLSSLPPLPPSSAHSGPSPPASLGLRLAARRAELRVVFLLALDQPFCGWRAVVVRTSGREGEAGKRVRLGALMRRLWLRSVLVRSVLSQLSSAQSAVMSAEPATAAAAAAPHEDTAAAAEQADAADAAAAAAAAGESGDLDDAEIAAMQARVAEMEEEERKMAEIGGGGGGGAGAAAAAGSPASAPGGRPMLTPEQILDQDSRSVHVSQVDYSVTEEELKKLFEACGAVNRATILKDKFSGNPKGFAYVEFAQAESVSNAMILNETEFKGRTLKVRGTNTSGEQTGRQARNGLLTSCSRSSVCPLLALC